MQQSSAAPVHIASRTWAVTWHACFEDKACVLVSIGIQRLLKGYGKKRDAARTDLKVFYLAEMPIRCIPAMIFGSHPGAPM